MQNTVAILTPPGIAAIAVVRLRGDRVAAFARSHLSRPPRAGACVHVELRDGGATLDDPVAVLADERTLDLSVHGGAWIVNRTVELAKRFGFAEAADEPPTDIEAEMLRDLPRALTREAVAILLAQPAAWEQMLQGNDREAMERALADRSLVRLLNPPTVAIVGAPNVGKSTLANQLFGRDRSITADLPGTTRDWVGEQANIDGLAVTLIDTPGLRATDDPIEREAIARSRGVIDRADAVVHVLDATAPSALDENADILVMNKVDRGPTWRVPNAIPVCATAGQGIDALRNAIRSHFGCADLSSRHARVWTERQRAVARGVPPVTSPNEDTGEDARAT